jgi:HK97 family phage prohead protease
LWTGALARDGHILVPQGCDLAGYRANPIVLWQQDPAQPVGRASAITTYSDRICARVTFAPEGVSPVADQCKGLVKSGVVSAVSVGFDPVDGEPLDPQRPRGGQRFTRWELLECSFVSVPADPGAVVTARNYQRDMAMPAHIIRASEAVDEAARHHHDLARALEADDYRRAMRSHREIGRCLRTAQACFKNLGSDATLADIANSQQAQTSSGVSHGTSDGRSIIPMTLSQRLAEVRKLVRPVQMDGGAIGCDAIRHAELSRNLTHIAAVGRAGGFRRAPRRAERQLELARLAGSQ